MNGKELLDTYPKVTNLIIKWFWDKRDVFKWVTHFDSAKLLIGKEIDLSPSSLFEFFDSLGVYINISTHKLDEEDDVKFIYYVCPMGDCIESCATPFNRRKDAEYYGMLAAIQYIDEHFDTLLSN